MGLLILSRALLLALACGCAASLSPLSAAGDDNDCALYLSGPGRTSAYDYSLNLLKGNFAYEGQHTCITYDAVNQAYLEARNRIVVSQPKGEWKAEDFASVGELILDISISLARRYGLTYEEIEKGLPLIDTSRTLIRDVCPPVFSHVECRAGKYRRLDGLCNNLQQPTWGSTMSPFQRLLGPLFADGINAPRIAHTGRDLPLSRVVSRTMHPDDGYHDHAGTVMVIAWGQFMDHDYTLTGTPLDPINRNDPEECCKRPPHLKHPYCNEIRIPEDDRFYGLWNVKCIDFVRAFPSPRPGCRLGSRVPFNTLTGVLDGNTVYGVTDKFARKLRTGFGGLLRMNPVFKEYGLKDLLPLKLDIPDEGCTRPNKNMYCFEGGEIRVNEQLVLTVMHTLMAREHNRIAKALAHVNPHWDDETLFQETRRINIAEIQHITYNEFLPILLGKDVMEKFGLVLEKEGYWDGYDQGVNPGVIDAFASAAFRFGHSLLPTAVERWSKAHKFIASKRLSDLIRRPFDLYRAGVLDEYVMGLMNQVAQAMDDSITQEVTNHLFKKVGARFGMDLVSFNMQRGREFGIPGYMEFRKFCGLNGADSFQDLFGSMPNETVRKYETIFEHPIDVDLWSGGVSERPLPGSMLGPTFACVIATQFSYSRRGDRFWYELPNQPSSFTPEQLVEVRKARLARVICDNTDIIDTVQLYPMVLPDHELNPRVPCRSGIIPSMDFSKWAEPTPFHGPKPFVTEAQVLVKNETETEEQIPSTKINETNNADFVVDTNTTLDANISQKEQESTSQITPCIKNCLKCTDCNKKNKQTHGTDTVLKYVYKKDNKLDSSNKSSSHSKNSLKRKRRNINDGLRYSASAPLIVNYETSHGPNTGSSYERQISGGIIKAADLADFNIETLHDVQPHKNNEEIINNRKAESEDNESSNESDNHNRNEHPNRDNKDSGERDDITPIERIETSESESSGENRNVSNEQFRKENHSDERSQERKEPSNKDEDQSRESYREEDDSREREKELHISNSDQNNNDRNNAFYKIPENSEEKDVHDKKEPHDSRESFESDRKAKNIYPESRERDNYRKDTYSNTPYSSNEQNEEKRTYKEDEPDSSEKKSRTFYPVSIENNDEHSDKKDDSREELYPNSKYLGPSIDSNEGGERSEESGYLKYDSRENYDNNDKSHYSTPREKSFDPNDKVNSEEGVLYRNEYYPKSRSTENKLYNNDNLSSNERSKLQSQEEEAIIAIMKRKRKPATPINSSKKDNEQLINSSIKITDVDLNDFSNFERIRVNNKGIVEPLSDNDDNYDTLSGPLIKPLTTSQPHTIKESGQQFERSTDGSDTSLNSESSEENKQPVQIDDEEVKPVVEFNADKEESLEENSKEAIKLNEDTSLETLLGVKLNSEEKSDKVIAEQDTNSKGDVKQQFERIPLNYNHVKKEQEENNESDRSNNEKADAQQDNPQVNQGTVDAFTPKEPINYDEHLNIKFDDVTVKLPEIKLPENILDFPYDEPFYVKKKKNKEPKKEKFYHYNDREYNDENPHENVKEDDHENVKGDDHDNHEPRYYSRYYGNGKEREDYKKKQAHNEEDDEEEDLYEKFVRERFGKTGTFAKRSEKLTAPLRPAKENAELFQALNLVLKKAANIEKEAKQSGDPKAGYMWTVEYGKPL